MNATGPTNNNEQTDTEPPDSRPKLGEAGCPIRVLNFAGGGFDTIMQLGVTHALLVIQGRAPDAVVGVSAGAIQAAALAEILQASDEKKPGDHPDPEYPVQEQGSVTQSTEEKAEETAWYQRRIAARVARFHEFVNACHRAREKILDAVLPDAYQIDSHDPLQPLRMPRFALRERNKRQDDLVARSGLVRLYNDFLSLNLPVGTISRITRRILGIRATSEIPSWLGRAFVIAIEIFRLWLLVMTDLFRIIPIVHVLLRPLFFSKVKAHATTAGDLIFRFKSWQFLVNTFKNSTSFLVLCTFTVTLSAVLLALPYLFSVGLIKCVPTLQSFKYELIVILYLFPLLFGFTRTLSQYDRETRWKAFQNISKAMVHFLWTEMILTLSLLPIVSGFALLIWHFDWLPHFVHIVGHQPDITISIVGYPINKNFTDAFFYSSRLLLAFSIFVIVAISVWTILVFQIHKRVAKKELVIPKSFISWYVSRFLNSYDLSKSLFHPHDMEYFLAELFDSKYYGKQNLDVAIENSLRDEVNASGRGNDDHVTSNQKRIAAYDEVKQTHPIKVGIAVANVSNGKLEVVPEGESVVSALLAATAVAPFLPAKQLGDRLYVDGSNIANVPTRALLKLLKHCNVNKDSGEIHVYGVSPLPYSKPELGREPGDTAKSREPFLDLIDIALRAIRLRQYCDAGLEYRLTEAYTNVIDLIDTKQGTRSSKINLPSDSTQDQREFFRMWVTPIEMEEPVALNKRIAFATKSKRREEILKTIADGCRAAMQVYIFDSVEKLCDTTPNNERQEIQCVSCKAAVKQHLSKFGSIQHLVEIPLPGSYSGLENGEVTAAEEGLVPTADDGGPIGPGVWEICQHCAIRDQHGELKNSEKRRMLKLHKDKNHPVATSWPHELIEEKSCFVAKNTTFKVDTVPETRKDEYRALQGHWPKQPAMNNTPVNPRISKNADTIIPSPASSPVERPMISLLFSGGVFRGVYQIGVLNALHELGVKPDVVAGASVGSITAAIVACILGVEKDAVNQKLQICRLAATYLAIDQIILTDRFSDFVRELTIRAAATRFSLRQADRLMRRYDQPWTGRFDHGARQVIAGLERLFYINPYQLNQLVRAIRNQRNKSAARIGRGLVQQWLDRMRVSEEILGAEPLSELIDHFILKGKGDTALKKIFNNPVDSSIKQFSEHGVIFLATCTDLTSGKLVTIGDPFSTAEYRPHTARIDEALLSSSAFPGVFRPRWSPEIFPGSNNSHQYIDGGVMDNFPIAPVVEFLEKASGTPDHPGLIVRRPGTPHLLVAASLEVCTPSNLSRARLEEIKNHWPVLIKRTKQLGYNTKLDIYQKAAQNIREIYLNTHNPQSQSDTTRKIDEPLDIEILPIKPNWLCGTFAFHPMLGYKRSLQAESIAHGCASTLLQFRAIDETWLKAWNVNIDRLPQANDFEEAFKRWRRWRNYATKGSCWLNYGKQCPFSETALKALNEKIPDCDAQLHDKTIAELSNIHRVCKKLKTHVREK